MATNQVRTNYERYTPQNYQPVDAAPLRSKAFSQIDNLPHSTSKTYAPELNHNTQNADKIAEIKKKYEKLLNKGVSKPAQTVTSIAVDHNRSVSGRDNNKRQQYSKGSVSPQPNYDKNNINSYEKSSTTSKRQPYKRDYCVAKTQEKKSNVEENRVALSAMKSELQARLSELSAKTIMSSAIRQQNQQTSQPDINTIKSINRQDNYQNYARSNAPQTQTANTYKYTEFANKNSEKQEYSNKYQNILNKYKHQGSNFSDKYKQRAEQRPAKPQQKSKQVSYLPKYINTKQKNEKMVKQQQLSVISQKSNSNNSQLIVENSLQLQDKIRDNQQVKMSYVRQIVDVRNDDIFRKTIDQSINYKKQKQPQKQYSYVETNYTAQKTNANSRYTNISTYSKERNYLNPSKNSQEQTQKPKEFTLHKLENNVGPIKRTTTEEHFKSFSKVNSMQTRQNREENKQKERYNNNYTNSSSKHKQIITNQTHNKYALHLQVELGQATFGKKNQKEALPIYEAAPQLSKNQKGSTQIEKLKHRYGKSTNVINNQNLDDTSNQKQEAEFQPSKKPTWKNYQFKDNKQISNKIDNLDKKIKEIENNKRNLNISFQPYQSKISTLNSCQVQKSAEKPQKRELTQKYQHKYKDIETKVNTDKKQEEQSRARVSSYYERVKPMYSDITLPQGIKTPTKGFAIKLMPVQNSNEDSRNPNDCSFSDNNSKSQIKQEFINKMEFELKADSGIQQRKRKLKEKVQSSNNVKTLVKIFGQQAVFDEIFRNNKIWFASQRSQTKWENLRRQLKSYHLNLSDSQMKQEFQLAQSENNPFFSVSDSKCDTKTLVSSYNQAKRHWSEKISKKSDRKSLEKEGFSSSKIDFDRKGFILIEDLVRFLNIQSGTFLRNRDVAIIFKRINKGSEKISFDELMDVVSC